MAERENIFFWYVKGNFARFADIIHHLGNWVVSSGIASTEELARNATIGNINFKTENDSRFGPRWNVEHTTVYRISIKSQKINRIKNKRISYFAGNVTKETNEIDEEISEATNKWLEFKLTKNTDNLSMFRSNFMKMDTFSLLAFGNTGNKWKTLYNNKFMIYCNHVLPYGKIGSWYLSQDDIFVTSLNWLSFPVWNH